MVVDSVDRLQYVVNGFIPEPGCLRHNHAGLSKTVLAIQIGPLVSTARAAAACVFSRSLTRILYSGR